MYFSRKMPFKYFIFFTTPFLILISCLNYSTNKKNNVVQLKESKKWNLALGLTNISDSASSIKIDSNNNVYIAGSIGDQPYLKKYNSSGKEIKTRWNKKINVGVISSLAIDGDNNIFAIGTTFGALKGKSDWWIKKFSATGVEDRVNWNKRCDFSGKNDSANGIAIDSKGNVYVAGDCYNKKTGFDWWIKKYSAAGKELWSKRCDLAGSTDISRSIAIDSDDNIYVVGSGYSGKAMWWIKKFSPSGREDKTNWNKTFSSKTEFKDYAYSIALDSKDNVYIAGSYNGSPFNDWWIKKFDSSGNEDTTNWDKIIDGNGFDDEAFSISIDSRDNIYVAGYGTELVNQRSNLDWWIKKFNQSGNELWDFRCDAKNDCDTPAGISLDGSDNLYVVGTAKNVINKSSEYDWWVKKFIPN